MHFFFLNALEPATQFYFFAVLITVVISITLHELAHGWMAIRLGDDTPIREGRMTGNPLVHMGPFSIVALLVVGIAWGQMPIDPTRLRGRHAAVWVALAGPAMNLGLGVVCLFALGLLQGAMVGSDAHWYENLLMFLQIAGVTNILLCLFNLVPVPPLDGSHILASYHQGYARAIADPDKQGLWMMAFIFIFVLSRYLWGAAWAVADVVMRAGHMVGSLFS